MAKLEKAVIEVMDGAQSRTRIPVAFLRGQQTAPGPWHARQRRQLPFPARMLMASTWPQNDDR